MDKEADKQHLIRNIEKRIRTAFIGALDILEKNLKTLSDSDKPLDVFREIRNQILDKGNEQIRLVNKEMNYWTCSKKRYHLELKVKEGDRNNG